MKITSNPLNIEAEWFSNIVLFGIRRTPNKKKKTTTNYFAVIKIDFFNLKIISINWTGV